MFSAKQNCVPERKKWCLKRKRFVGEIKKVNLDWCESRLPLWPEALPAGDESPTCVRGMCESNIQQQQQPPCPFHLPPPLPAAHTRLAGRHVTARIRSYNQTHSTFRLAQPQGLPLSRHSPVHYKPLGEAKLWAKKDTGKKKKRVRDGLVLLC